METIPACAAAAMPAAGGSHALVAHHELDLGPLVLLSERMVIRFASGYCCQSAWCNRRERVLFP